MPKTQNELLPLPHSNSSPNSSDVILDLSVAESPESVKQAFKYKIYSLRASQAGLYAAGIWFLAVSARPLEPAQLLWLSGCGWVLCLVAAILLARSHNSYPLSLCLLAVRHSASIIALSACTAVLGWENELLAKCMLISAITGAGSQLCLMSALGSPWPAQIVCHFSWFLSNIVCIDFIFGTEGLFTLGEAFFRHTILAVWVTLGWAGYWNLVDWWYLPRNMSRVTAGEVESGAMYLKEGECSLLRVATVAGEQETPNEKRAIEV